MDIVVLVVVMVLVIVVAGAWLPRNSIGESAPRVFENKPIVTMQYADRDGVVTERTVAILSLEVDQGAGRVVRFQGWCGLRGAQREFRVDRILWLRDEVTGDAVADIGQHLKRYVGSAR